jgi:DNA-binding NarL/FixJ family response regulator
VRAKTSQPKDYVKAIRGVYAGDVWVAREALVRVLDYLRRKMHQEREFFSGSWKNLTDREREVLKWTAHGMTNKEIARALGISNNTVKTHLQHIFSKCKVTRRLELFFSQIGDDDFLDSGLS